ncbi:hypothetical protein NHX12_008149 [Muraenolepis orangiensis]|uniref:J domain-containing protein n=1 Tax=Muraenolepis orangiensis TaxID=630683 RepID=A0A9Q0DNB1_9TELE|nr:hypothetical protein NHX12_008149 [Muraenolepis orangiensis]
MAEVAQRLSNGAQRFSALLQTRCRPVFPSGARAHGGVTESSRGLCEIKPLSNIETMAHMYSKTLKRTGIQHANTNLPIRGLIPLVPGVFSLDGLIQNHKTPLYASPSVQPVLRVGVLVGRMTCWSNKEYRAAAAVHSEPFSSPQQFRKFSVLILTAAEHGDSIPGNTFRPQQLKHHLHVLRSTTRGYSSNNTTQAAPLYRSRTAYYDLLKVSLHATQSQIKTAYYKQSFIFHPDKNLGSEEATLRFSEVSEAYTVLGNVGLRRKYDRGILSPSDIQGAGRPSSKEASRGAPGPQQHHHHHQQQQQHRHTASQQQYAQRGGKPMFDFDAFYQAHYGEQLEREQRARARNKLFEERRKQSAENLKLHTTTMTICVLMVIGGMILISDLTR